MSNDKKLAFETISLSKYEPPKIIPSTINRWTLFGDNNDYFEYIKHCYKNSPTNAGIINGYISYLYGDGLIDTVTDKFITKIITRKDARLILSDFKTYGQCAIQVIWNNAIQEQDKKPLQIKYLPIRKVGLNINEDMEVNGYWYSFNWKETKYAPKFYNKFDGQWNGNNGLSEDPNVEILVISRPTDDDYFALPDYEAGLVYADLEAELANSTISHVQNGFQGGTLINCNSGIPPTEELRQEYKKRLISQYTGTNNSNKIILSFNENAEQAMTIDKIDISELNNQYESFDERAERKLIIAHSAPPILFSGSRDGGGLGSNSDEIKEATASLYRRHIYPMRETVLDGLQSVVDLIDENITLGFRDFNELETNQEIQKENE